MKTSKSAQPIELQCPKCGHSLSAALRQEVEVQVRRDLEAEREEWMTAEKEKIEQRLKVSLSSQLTDLQEALVEKEKSNEKLRREQLALRKKERELEEAQAELKLEVERRLQREKHKLLEHAVQTVTEANRLKLAEKDKLLSDMQKQIEELKRRSDVTGQSQKRQGDAQEEDIAEKLMEAFPNDSVTRVKSGKNGADIEQVVRSGRGQVCGRILFESKRTKAFAGDWTSKLRADMREAKADLGVIVTESLPKDVVHAGYVDGVWVISPAVLIPFATVLRAQLVEIKNVEAKTSADESVRGQVFTYVSGPVFRQRLTAILEGFISMQNQLEAEQRAMQLQWAKRSQTIHMVLDNTAKVYGELSGIAALPEIPQLALPVGGL